MPTGMAHASKPGAFTVDLDYGLEVLGLDARLADTPSTAHVRGLFFKLAEQALGESSPDLLTVWRAVSGARSRWPFNMYSAREFLREQAVAAVLLEPRDPGVALRRMWSSTPKLSPLIRATGFIRYLTGREPMAALRWLERNRAMMCDYGTWRVESTGPSSALFHYHDEYTWVEHCHLGGVEGTLQRCGVTPTVTVHLQSPYRGHLQVSWK